MHDDKVPSCECGYEVTAIDEVLRGLGGAATRRSRRRFDSRARGPLRLLLLVALTGLAALVLAAAPAGSGTGGPIARSSIEPAADDTCTIASMERRATIEVQVAHAADLCELLSQVLAISVFRAPLFVTPGALWHYPGSDPSCQLRFGRTRNRMVVRNSVHTCRWFARHWSGWRTEEGGAVGVGVRHA